MLKNYKKNILNNKKIMKETIRKTYSIIFFIIYFPFAVLLWACMLTFDIIMLPFVFINKNLWYDDDYFYVMKRMWLFDNE